MIQYCPLYNASLSCKFILVFSFIFQPGQESGCTAILTLIQNNQIIVANVGDSRCVLSRAGKAIDLSEDHKPENSPERERIVAAGGKVTAEGRVNGGLNLSRALGKLLLPALMYLEFLVLVLNSAICFSQIFSVYFVMPKTY